MDFNRQESAQQQNKETMDYLVGRLSDPEAGRAQVEMLFSELGDSVSHYPAWHPILSLPPKESSRDVYSISNIGLYEGADHTRLFVQGFVTCPYDKSSAKKLVRAVEESGIRGLTARRIKVPLYADGTYPVVVEACNLELEKDGTIESRCALVGFLKHFSNSKLEEASYSEEWKNISWMYLGSPGGHVSSLFASEETGRHMKSIVKAINASGMLGPVYRSVDVLSKMHRDAACLKLLKRALAEWEHQVVDDGHGPWEFAFTKHGETCRAQVRDTFKDETEFSISVDVGDGILHASGWYYPAEENRIQAGTLMGKRDKAHKFL